MDEVDKKIIAQLQADGEHLLRNLSKIHGFHKYGNKEKARKTVEKRNNQNISSDQPKRARASSSNRNAGNGERRSNARTSLNRFEECPRIVQIFKTIGGYNLMALVVAETIETLESISMEKCSLRCSKGIRRSEFYPVSETYFSPFLQIRENLATKEKKVSPCNVEL